MKATLLIAVLVIVFYFCEGHSKKLVSVTQMCVFVVLVVLVFQLFFFNVINKKLSSDSIAIFSVTTHQFL